MLPNPLINLMYLFLVLGFGIVILVFSILLVISHLGGWGALAREYESAPEIDKGALLEEKFQRKAWVGLSSFGGLVKARCFERGLELKAGFPFSPPLFFPWDEIQDYKRITALPFPNMDQFTVSNRRIRLSNHLSELEKHKQPIN